jgi:magnesium chelatase family protein
VLAVVKSLTVAGMEAATIQVEVDVSSGLPSFDLVGLPDTAVRESKERVRTAIKNSGFEFPAKRITVNLAPADLKKEGPGFDLPIAIGILASTGQLNGDHWRDWLFIGELSLKGDLRSVPGVLSMAWYLAQSNPGAQLVVPADNGYEAGLIKDTNVIAVSDLGELVSFLNGEITIEPLTVNPEDFFRATRLNDAEFNLIQGQAGVKRGLEIAAAGGHNVLLMGPPGGGKTLLARSLTSILPPLGLHEALEVSRIYSVAGLLTREHPLIVERPFRAPHHTASTASVIGGGRTPKPGELSLATHGILFLDELLEFRRDVLEALRQPLEDRRVTVTRVQASYDYPADFMLVATANPCPCGYYGDRKRECSCTPYQIQKYRNKLSGPLLDRIDLQMEVPRLTLEELQAEDNGEDAQTVRERVTVARRRQMERLSDYGMYYNAQIKGPMVQELCPIDDEGTRLLHRAFARLGLSMRAHHRLIKIARTIADLDGSELITGSHIAEALQYRILDRQTS